MIDVLSLCTSLLKVDQIGLPMETLHVGKGRQRGAPGRGGGKEWFWYGATSAVQLFARRC